MRTNYLGSVWCLNAFLPGLGPGSHVVNIVSVAGTVADGPYSAAKHAQLAFSRSVAVELAAARHLGAHDRARASSRRPGFPQEGTVPLPAALPRRRPLTLVVERTLGAIEHDQREIVVPRWYAPGLVGCRRSSRASLRG